MGTLLTTTNSKGKTVVSLRGWIILVASASTVGNTAVLVATMILGHRALGWRVFDLATSALVVLLYAGEPKLSEWRKRKRA